MMALNVLYLTLNLKRALSNMERSLALNVLYLALNFRVIE